MFKAHLLLATVFGSLILATEGRAQRLSLGSSLYPGFPFKHPYFTDGATATSGAQFQSDILPQSPEAEAMAKHTLLPVTLYDGLANISVPIYEIKTPNLDIPITLSYNYSGFKPAETASSVGLGWNVQGGGVVMHHVKSRVDHMDVHVVGNDYDNYTNINFLSGIQTVLQNMALGEVDGEPDLYVFNAPGLSGKFIMMQGKAYMFPYQQIQIKSLGYDAGFIITNEKGDRYFFEDAEQSHHQTTSQFGEYVPDHASAFFLSKIISADLTDTVQYSYSNYTFSQPPNYSETLTVTEDQNKSAYPIENYQETGQSGDYIQSLVLNEIQSKNAIVLFNPSSTYRTDVWITDSTMYPLGTIQVFGVGSALTKTFKLQHGYLGGKLSLTEVDETLPTGGDTSLRDTTMEKYTFEYAYPDTTQGSIPGWNTKSVDYAGYYNGAPNTTLFTVNDVPVSDQTLTNYAKANRAPSYGYAEQNALSKITYPTGGYDVISYGGNQTGVYQVGPGTTPQGRSSSTGWYTNDGVAKIDGKKTLYGSISFNAAQFVQIQYEDEDESEIEGQKDTIVTLYSDQLYQHPIWGSPNVGGAPDGTDSLLLQAGTYYYKLVCDSLEEYNYAGFNYYTVDVTNTLADAPGIRVQEVDSYDGIHPSPVLAKHYTYNNGYSLYNTLAHKTSVHQDASSCYNTDNHGAVYTSATVTSIQAGLNPSISDFINNTFYYPSVQETDMGYGTNGITTYSYSAFLPNDPDVALVQKTVYKYTLGTFGAQYTLVSQTTNNYSTATVKQFVSFTSSITSQAYQSSGVIECSGTIATPDPTEPVATVTNVYGSTQTQLTSGYKYLGSTVETSWDTAGQNPLTNVTTYSYDNPSHIFPTRIVTTNSKGDTVTTQLKYPLDYPAGSILNSSEIDSLFTIDSWRQSDSLYNDCYDNLLDALNPYQPYSLHVDSFTNVANSYHCQSNYASNSQLAFNARNTRSQNRLFSPDSAERADAVAWHRGLYWMQSNNVVSPVIEKYVSIKKSGGSDYLVSASRDSYALLFDPRGDTVAKRTGVLETELAAPVLKSTFLANTDAYYHNEVNIGYDASLKMSSQTKVGDMHYSYLWGYNHMLVVAEVAGSDSATVAGFVNQSVLDNPLTSQAAMQTELNKVRTGLAGTKALVTTATYDPLVGLTSKTDPAGRTTFFAYDNLGRLVNIKDQDGNIVKTFFYHYVN